MDVKRQQDPKQCVLVRFSHSFLATDFVSWTSLPQEVLMANTMPNVRSEAQDRSKSHPYFTQKVKLHSFHAQQVFDRGFELCANAIFSLSVVLRIIGTDEQAREVEGIVDERLNKMFEDIRSEAARLEKLAEANGIEFNGIEYSHPKELEAKITSPRAVRYLGIVREFDGLVAKLDTLWLSGVIPDGNYSRSIYEWKRRLLRLAGGIRSISGRAMIAARRKEAQGDDKTLAETGAEAQTDANGHPGSSPVTEAAASSSGAQSGRGA
ncbi:AcaB family transcriptional regulator [Pelomicrobium methylotrophicum]|uniref:AcaB family transcriptional regulator n=1 Tax=Pelomicrobium methylotrophicum TaxID=2602750 RepID=UPI001969CA35|nr:AcaB family transcriptional regulator [Pelomicrobium methylotrophicum]